MSKLAGWEKTLSEWQSSSFLGPMSVCPPMCLPVLPSALWEPQWAHIVILYEEIKGIFGDFNSHHPFTRHPGLSTTCPAICWGPGLSNSWQSPSALPCPLPHESSRLAFTYLAYLLLLILGVVLAPDSFILTWDFPFATKRWSTDLMRKVKENVA